MVWRRRDIGWRCSRPASDGADGTRSCCAGIGIDAKLGAAVKEADLLIVVGARLGEMTTSQYSLLDIPNPKQFLVHVHPAPDELGTVYRPDLPIVSTAGAFASALLRLTPPKQKPWSKLRAELRASYEKSLDPIPLPGSVKLAEVVRILGDIGHDIRNMLMPVVCAGDLLKSEFDEIYGLLAATQAQKAQTSRQLCHEVIEMLQRNTQRIQDRVKEIADCVKGLSTPPTFVPCKVPEIVDNVMKVLSVLAQEKGVSLRTEGLDTLPTIMADERRLYNAFYNLVNNAIPEVPAGGRVTVRGQAEEDAIRLWVSDTGRGMPPEVRESLFTARAISRKEGGTGLGTKIVKDVVDAHGGQITVQSQVGVGTTFSICLPLRPSGCTGKG